MSAQSFPTPTSTLYKLACDFERAANAGDHVAMGALLADDYTSQFYPASLRTPGFEARANKTDTLNRAKQMLGEGGLIKQLNVSLLQFAVASRFMASEPMATIAESLMSLFCLADRR